MTARLIADDLFAGAGGWDVAADWLDVHAQGVENMPQARATRDAAGLTTVHDDVWTFKPRYRANHSALPSLIAAGLIASPPCQTFSAAGKGAGRKALDDVLTVLPKVADMTLPELREAGEVFGDDRTALVLTPLWFALHHPYRWLAWEQVPTVLPVWEACAEVLRDLGWQVWTGNLQAEQYGVPQTRKRAFLLASRDHEVAPPTPTHSRYYPRNPTKLDPGVAKWVSMAEALTPLGLGDPFRMVSNYGSGGDSTNRGERTSDQPAPTITSKIDRNVIYRNNPMPNQAHRHLGQPAPTLAFGKALPEWCHNRPATTVVGSFKPEVIAAPGFRTTVSRQNAPDSVRVSVAEAAVLQSFPVDHPWQGAKGKQYLQVGNAVPPLLAMAALCAALGEPYVPPNTTREHTEVPGAAAVEYVNGNQANAARRRGDRPAPTVHFGARSNHVTWQGDLLQTDLADLADNR